jgi:hypothetical protein
MPTPREYYNDWLQSPWSTAENFMPYDEYAAIRASKEANANYNAAKKSAANAAKTLKSSKTAVKKAGK